MTRCSAPNADPPPPSLLAVRMTKVREWFLVTSRHRPDDLRQIFDDILFDRTQVSRIADALSPCPPGSEFAAADDSASELLARLQGWRKGRKGWYAPWEHSDEPSTDPDEATALFWDIEQDDKEIRVTMCSAGRRIEMPLVPACDPLPRLAALFSSARDEEIHVLIVEGREEEYEITLRPKPQERVRLTILRRGVRDVRILDVMVPCQEIDHAPVVLGSGPGTSPMRSARSPALEMAAI